MEIDTAFRWITDHITEHAEMQNSKQMIETGEMNALEKVKPMLVGIVRMTERGFEVTAEIVRSR